MASRATGADVVQYEHEGHEALVQPRSGDSVFGNMIAVEIVCEDESASRLKGEREDKVIVVDTSGSEVQLASLNVARQEAIGIKQLVGLRAATTPVHCPPWKDRVNFESSLHEMIDGDAQQVGPSAADTAVAWAGRSCAS